MTTATRLAEASKKVLWLCADGQMYEDPAKDTKAIGELTRTLAAFNAARVDFDKLTD